MPELLNLQTSWSAGRLGSIGDERKGNLPKGGYQKYSDSAAQHAGAGEPRVTATCKMVRNVKPQALASPVELDQVWLRTGLPTHLE